MWGIINQFHRLCFRWVCTLLSFFLILTAHAKTITIDQKPAAGQAILADLNQTLGLPWQLIQMPVPFFEKDFDFQAIDGRNAWMVFDDTPLTQGSSIWRLSDGNWQQVDLGRYSNRLLGRIFAATHQDVWISIQVPPALKHNILHYDGQKWTEMVTPNSDRIRALAMSSETFGWAGCEWGQLMRYDGSSWRLSPSPTSSHIIELNLIHDSLGYALLMAKNKHYRLLKFNGFQWLPMQAEERSWLDILMADVIHGDAYAVRWDNRETETVEWMLSPAAVRDTVLITYADQPEKVLLSHNSGTRLRGKLARSFFNAPDKEWIACIMEPSAPSVPHSTIILHFINKACEKRDVILRITQPKRARFLFDQTSFFASSFYLHEHGIAVADYNGDGFDDLYTIATGESNHLFLRQPDAITRLTNECAAEYGVAGISRLSSGLVNYDEGANAADVDDDGDQDIIVTSLYGEDVLFRNIRNNRFRAESSKAGIGENLSRSCSAAFADVNGDGAVDLYISSEDSTNCLFLNNGAGIFNDVTREAGLWFNRAGGSAAFADIDGDLDPDLFVPRYGQRNLLFINQGSAAKGGIPTFIEQGTQAGVAGSDTLFRSTSAVFADTDNDGDLDLFVTNLSAQNWFYRNEGHCHFSDITEMSGLAGTDISQTAQFLDADNDGDLDLLVGNRGLSRFYENLGENHFAEQTQQAGIFKPTVISGMACIDIENDGDMDVYLGQGSNYSTCLLNMTNNDHFLQVKALGDRSNRDAIGSKILIYKSGFEGQSSALLAMREVQGGSGYNSLSSRTVHFGLPSEEAVDVKVIFPSGMVQILRNVHRGQTINVVESDSWTRRVILMEKWLARKVKSPESLTWLMVVSLFFLLFTAAQWFFIRIAKWPGYTIYLMVVVPFSLLITLIYFLDELSPDRYYPLAIGISLLAWGLAFSLHRTQQKRHNIKIEDMESLYLSTTAFFHGGWAARKLNRIEFFCQNMGAGKTWTQEIIVHFMDAVDDYFTMLVPELEKILGYAIDAGLPGSIRHNLRNAMLNLAEALNDLKVDLRTERPSDFDETMRRSHILKTELEGLRKHIANYFCAAADQTVEKIYENFQKEGIEMIYENDAGYPLIVRLPVFALSQIIENTVENAQQAVAITSKKIIRIQIDANSEYVFIRIFDSGPGVHPDVAKKLFKEQVSTKVSPGGFGLYHAKITLQKYGGDIRLMDRAESGDETGFEIMLKRIVHE